MNGERARGRKGRESGKESVKMAFNYSKCWNIKSGLHHRNLLQPYLIYSIFSSSLKVCLFWCAWTHGHTERDLYTHTALACSPICTQLTRIKLKSTHNSVYFIHYTRIHSCILVHRWYVSTLMRNSLIREKHVYSVHTIYFNEFAFLFCFLLFGTFRI